MLLLRRLGEARAVGVALAAFAGAALALLSTSVVVVTAGLAVVGVAIPWLVVALVTARQRAAPPRLQGRAAAATGMSMQVPQLASIAAGAALVEFVDYRWLVLAASVVVTGAAVSLLLGRRELSVAASTVQAPVVT